MRALIAGTGSIGQRHIHNIRRLVPQTDFVFLRRHSEKNEFSRSCNAHVVASIEQAFDPAPDFAVIATPSALHMSALVPLIESGQR